MAVGKSANISRQALVERLIAAIESHPAPNGEPINDEHLALLCEGEINALSEADRQRLLRQIAAEPWAAELVKELHDEGWGPKASLSIGTALLRAAPVAWAMAACVVICLGVWRVAAPPGAGTNPNTSVVIQPPVHPPDKSVGPSVPDQANVSNEDKKPPQGNVVGVFPSTQSSNATETHSWREIGPAPTASSSEGRSLRDVALILAIVALAVLTGPAVWWAMVRRELRGINSY